METTVRMNIGDDDFDMPAQRPTITLMLGEASDIDRALVRRVVLITDDVRAIVQYMEPFVDLYDDTLSAPPSPPQLFNTTVVQNEDGTEGEPAEVITETKTKEKKKRLSRAKVTRSLTADYTVNPCPAQLVKFFTEHSTNMVLLHDLLEISRGKNLRKAREQLGYKDDKHCEPQFMANQNDVVDTSIGNIVRAAITGVCSAPYDYGTGSCDVRYDHISDNIIVNVPRIAEKGMVGGATPRMKKPLGNYCHHSTKQQRKGTRCYRRLPVDKSDSIRIRQHQNRRNPV